MMVVNLNYYLLAVRSCDAVSGLMMYSLILWRCGRAEHAMYADWSASVCLQFVYYHVYNMQVFGICNLCLNMCHTLHF